LSIPCYRAVSLKNSLIPNAEGAHTRPCFPVFLPLNHEEPDAPYPALQKGGEEEEKLLSCVEYIILYLQFYYLTLVMRLLCVHLTYLQGGR
jgi:hypothetical protein